MTIEAGERVLLLGPSGSGKSTLLTAIAGLVDPAGGAETEGTLLVDGRDPRETRDRTGLLFQDPASQIVMGRVGDDVAFGLENRCVPTDRISGRIDAALAAVDFPYGRGHPTHALSGGEEQRLALAGTLALQPGLLMLDEPTANLDPDGAAEVRAVLSRLLDALGSTMLLVDHRVDEMASLVDRLIVLGHGSGVIVDGPPRDVFSAHARELSAAGVWVPDGTPPVPSRRARPVSQALVSAEGASFRYPGTARSAVEGVDLLLRSSEAVAIVGPNGSGKTTLALLLAGLIAPRAGRVLACDALAAGRNRQPIAGWTARELVRHIGMVFQNPEHQLLAGSVREELLLGPMRAGLDAGSAARRADELLERLGLAHLARVNPFTLSGGEKRRLSVATALATAPRLLVLDEPTFGQDRRTWSELLHLLSTFRDDGGGVCFVTHDRAFADALADHTLALHVSR